MMWCVHHVVSMWYGAKSRTPHVSHLFVARRCLKSFAQVLDQRGVVYWKALYWNGLNKYLITGMDLISLSCVCLLLIDEVDLISTDFISILSHHLS